MTEDTVFESCVALDASVLDEALVNLQDEKWVWRFDWALSLATRAGGGAALQHPARATCRAWQGCLPFPPCSRSPRCTAG
jgi:hypothetical protein